MKTTELVIEQVLIGFLVIFIIGMLGFYDPCLITELQKKLTELETISKIGLGAALVAAAYWVGIIYDRCADTILKDFDQHGRLQVGLDGKNLSELTKDEDPFPEAALRLMIQTNSSVVEWADYLRTRIRLMRSLATLMPALSAVWLFIAVSENHDMRYSYRISTVFYLSFIYTAVFLTKLKGWPTGPPRTDNYKRLETYVEKHNRKEDGTIKLGYIPDDLKDLAFVGLILLFFLGLVQAWHATANAGASWKICLIPATGLGLSLLVGWCWLRINRTFFFYLRTAYENSHFLGMKTATTPRQKKRTNMDSIERSTEIRWFFPGDAPSDVNDWFYQNTRFGDALSKKDGDERTDLYLPAVGNIDLSPKLREGKFEIKYRIKTSELKCKSSGASGTIENWLKWKWRYADVKAIGEKYGSDFNEHVISSFMEKNSKEFRCKVSKNRFQRKFRIADKNDPIPVPLKEYIETGFKAELTELKINGTAWWTIAFEIVGEVPESISILTECVRWAITGYPDNNLQADVSYSYPEWISRLD